MSTHHPPERAEFQTDGQEGYYGDHAARYEYASHFVCGKRVIDAACGSGYGTVRLKLAGATFCQGIDCDEDTVAANRARYAGQGAEFVVGDCQTYDFAALRPDVIVSFETIEHIENPPKFLAAVRQGLSRDEGVFLVSCPNNEDLGDNPYHLHSWDAESFRSLLGEYFSDVLILGQCHNPAYHANAEFGRYVDMQLGVLWNQPWTRLWRGIRRLLGRQAAPSRPRWGNLMPGPHDWSFVPDFGPKAKRLLAVCR